MNKKKKAAKVTGYILTGIILVFSIALFVVCKWSKTVLNVSIGEILFTIKSPLKGADTSIVNDGLNKCLPLVLTVFIVYVTLVIVDIKLKIKVLLSFKFGAFKFSVNLRHFARRLISALTLISFVASLLYANSQYQIVDYIKSRFDTTTIYEDYYVHPNDVNIKADGDEKNLICIYLESMETTYASTQDGGAQDVNYIPNLTRLAKENVSFSNTDKLGGFGVVPGTYWTMGALFAFTAGIPFAFPVEHNSMNLYQTFASNLTTFGDVLDSFGYNQYFLCGSDGDFAGRKSYYEQHKNYKVLDLFTAREEGYIPSDYYVFWGFEDKYLYEIAKDYLTEIGNNDKPFNFSMLTVDTHFPDGYVCELCGSDFESRAANVVSCADKQIQSFIDWCKQQPFYDNTVIVILGDHPRMDTTLVKNVEYVERAVYNCFINGPDTDCNKTNRIFSHMDMFPTILSAMGFEYDGNRIGLGTNMFSGEPTLCEKLGFDYVYYEVEKRSKYYIDNFN